MSVNNGKFFDVGATQAYFNNIKTEFDSFSKLASTQTSELESFSKSNCWEGLDAELAKKLMGSTEKTLLQEIMDIHVLVDGLEEELLEKFRLEVDNAPDARIDFDTLVTINSDFQHMYTSFDDLSVHVLAQVQSFQTKYGKFSNVIGKISNK